jgi:hypothetical protein
MKSLRVGGTPPIGPRCRPRMRRDVAFGRTGFNLRHGAGLPDHRRLERRIVSRECLAVLAAGHQWCGHPRRRCDGQDGCLEGLNFNRRKQRKRRSAYCDPSRQFPGDSLNANMPKLRTNTFTSQGDTGSVRSATCGPSFSGHPLTKLIPSPMDANPMAGPSPDAESK